MAERDTPTVLTEDPWRSLRRYTDARIGLGRVGVSLPTRELLAFQLAHAQARDAVHLALDTARLVGDLRGLDGLAEPLLLGSQAVDRDDYLRHPPKGRTLSDGDATGLTRGEVVPDLALVIVDGLSSHAVQQNAAPFLRALLDQLPPLRLSAPVVVTQGRVAVGDHVAERLGAQAVLVMIGERPGLSSPDSLGLYFTWAPRVGFNDARRNCISNVRPAGLDYGRAAARAAYLLAEAQRLGTSGVALKDRSTDDAAGLTRDHTSFLSLPPA
ncbi:Ethanolamine ammonia-lyase light chain [Loktanella fryxellensis]|uniref:Ethanolamine ammonia-lyase small subunit n=1 Tax=Loktanella fryxellensis TaxID=245187 RepID=A0A1H7ZM64_9RHOB|nr:ethanolamine ammonia-lyase subunit EutC [Loktanella fryxellensis]SEM58628.1 Ethanolamine ammonia-lyase light chain [Loktanella fryxellensis]